MLVLLAGFIPAGTLGFGVLSVLHAGEGGWAVYETAASLRGNVTFLFPNKKVTKEVGLRGAELIAPAIKAALLRITRPALFCLGGP